jgi:chloramphenicol-sensitive protein RarD
VWSFVFLSMILTLTRGWRGLKRFVSSAKTLAWLAGASVAVATNWTIYVYSVSTDQVVEASLGYFINPLVSVCLGVLLLKERLRRTQWLAVSIAAAGVITIAVAYGAPPWIGLGLAFSFGMYGLLKKVIGAGAIESLTTETAILLPVAITVLAVAETSGSAVFAQDGLGISVLLMLLGPITAVPLLAFGGAATRVPLSVLGLVQYLTPTAIFILGVTFFDEKIPSGAWLGFAVIWFALIIFSLDAFRAARASRPVQLQSGLNVTEPDQPGGPSEVDQHRHTRGADPPAVTGGRQ